jgi:hypothetical protein
MVFRCSVVAQTEGDEWCGRADADSVVRLLGTSSTQGYRRILTLIADGGTNYSSGKGNDRKEAAR